MKTAKFSHSLDANPVEYNEREIMYTMYANEYMLFEIHKQRERAIERESGKFTFFVSLCRALENV